MSTLLPVPWEPGVAAVIADLRRAGDDRPEPLDPRGALRSAVKALGALGYSPIVGPELEFHLCRGAPLARSLHASLDALEQDSFLRALIAPQLLDTFVAVKRFELERHRAWVSDWEVEEYIRHL